MEIFFTILILILVVSLSGVVTRMLPFQIPLPLMQIAVGALLAWPNFELNIGTVIIAVALVVFYAGGWAI